MLYSALGVVPVLLCISAQGDLAAGRIPMENLLRTSLACTVSILCQIALGVLANRINWTACHDAAASLRRRGIDLLRSPLPGAAGMLESTDTLTVLAQDIRHVENFMGLGPPRDRTHNEPGPVLGADPLRCRWAAHLRAGADRLHGRAACHEAILQLPMGYDTDVGEAGKRLSGGERQQLALARALLADTPILLLDEITSALDPTNEQHIVATLEELRKTKTILVIAHRLSTITSADSILVLDHGAIAAQGSHKHLLETSPLYRLLWTRRLQASGWRLAR